MKRETSTSYHTCIRSRAFVLILVVTAWLTLAVPAFAGKTKVYDPPGKAGANEYAEVIPSAGGNVAPPSSGGGNTTAAQISKLGAGKLGIKKLTKLGTQGSAAAQFALQTAPSPTPTRLPPAKASLPPRPGTAVKAPAGSALAGVGQLLGGSDIDGLGLVLPVSLAALTACALGYVLRRRFTPRGS
jgi:hypothetical protein